MYLSFSEFSKKIEFSLVCSFFDWCPPPATCSKKFDQILGNSPGMKPNNQYCNFARKTHSVHLDSHPHFVQWHLFSQSYIVHGSSTIRDILDLRRDWITAAGMTGSQLCSCSLSLQDRGYSSACDLCET